MNTRTNVKNGDELSILGFGCMRLPGGSGGVDEPRSVAMIRRAAERGVNYFDTAYIYHRGRSESVLGKALAGGLRERVKVATKLPLFMTRSLDAAKRIFATQLERLRSSSVDYYLLHALPDKAAFDRLQSMGVTEWLGGLKARGVVRNIGFSFHGTKADFQTLLQAYPWDICQIQYNYMDENSQAGKAGLLLAADRGVPVVVMEPLRGGTLADRLPREAKEAFASVDARRSPAEWALRWVWDHPQVTCALSGMSDEAQLAENLRVASDAEPGSLSAKELEAFSRVKAILLEKIPIPCTACGYCLPCPYGVDIPGCFSHYNDREFMGRGIARFRYLRDQGALASKPSNASLCRACGKCEPLCPQGIGIIRELKTVSREMEGALYGPLVGIARKILKIR